MTIDEYIKSCCSTCKEQQCQIRDTGGYCDIINDIANTWIAAEKTTIEKACKLWHKNVLKAQVTEEEFKKAMLN